MFNGKLKNRLRNTADYATRHSKLCLSAVQWSPGIGPPQKANHPGIRTTFFQSQIFPHSHNVLSDSESGPTRDSGHEPGWI